jgi:hypothetical protein
MTPRFKATPSRRLVARGATDGLAASTRAALERMNAEYEKLTNDAHLTDLGRKARLTEAAKIPLSALNERRKAIKAKRKELDASAAKLFAERAPVAATDSERREALMIWEKAEAAQARGDTMTATRLRRVFEGENPDAQTYRLQLAFLSLHPALVGLHGEQIQRVTTMKLGLNEARDEASLAIADEVEALAEEEAQLVEARSVIIAASDRAALEEAGFLMKRATTWTSEERAAFIDKHGADAYRELLHDEMRERLGPPLGVTTNAGLPRFHDSHLHTDDAAAAPAAPSEPPAPLLPAA